MLPFAVIKEKKKQQHKPIVWHSRQHMKIHGLEINQPRPKIYSERHPYRQTQHNIRDSFDSAGINEVKGKHIIDLNRQKVKGFRVGEVPQNERNDIPNRDSNQTDIFVPKEKRNTNEEERASRSIDGNTHEDQEQVKVRQYTFRLENEQQYTPKQQKLTFTEQVVNQFGNGIYQKNRTLLPFDKLPSIKIPTQRQNLDPHLVIKLHRQLGIFAKKKEYSDDFEMKEINLKQIRVEQGIEYQNFSNDQVVNMVEENKNQKQHKGMIEESRSEQAPWKEGSLEGSQQWKEKKKLEESRSLWKEGSLEGSRQWKEKKQKSGGSWKDRSGNLQESGAQSRSGKHRVKIFSTENLDPLQPEPVHSQYMNGSSGDKKSRDAQNVILEESQVKNFEQHQVDNAFGNFIHSNFIKSKYSIDFSQLMQKQQQKQVNQKKDIILEKQENQRQLTQEKQSEAHDAMSKNRKHMPIFEEFNKINEQEEQEDASPPIEPIKVKKIVIWGHKQLPDAKQI